MNKKLILIFVPLVMIATAMAQTNSTNTTSYVIIEGNGMMPSILIALMPLIFGFLIVFGASQLSEEEHPVLKIALVLFSYMTYFMSAWLAVMTVIKYADFAPMQEGVVTTVWIIGAFMFVVLSYFMIYVFYKGVNAAAQKKEEMMGYGKQG